jgi:hypothetical protein
VIHVRFASLAAPFRIVRAETFPDWNAVLVAVKAHAEPAGYTDIQPVADVDSFRYIARTPGGRHGRDVAFADLDWGD